SRRDSAAGCQVPDGDDDDGRTDRGPTRWLEPADERGDEDRARVGAIGFLAPSVWIFVDTQGFAEAVAPWADYGEHVVHDGGACQIGLGVAIVAVLLWQEAIGAVLAGFTAGMLLHALSRLVDGDTP